MNMDKNNVGIGFGHCVFYIIAFLVLFFCVVHVAFQRDQIAQDAVSLGYAEYNAKSGQWQWITNTLNNNKTN